MPNKARRDVENQTRLIRKLMDTDNLNKEQVIDKLKIDERTFRRYLKRIMAQDAKLHEQQNKDSVKYREAKFHETLEDGYLIAKKIAEDTKTSARDRLEAIKVMSICQAQLSKLVRYGAIFEPQLPDNNKVLELEQR
jgi:hypothetical protein